MDPQPFYRWAWCLEVQGPATIRVSTTDLPQGAAVATLGAFYKKAIKGVDGRIVDGLPNLFYGVRHRSTFQLTVSNADGDMDPTWDWRGAPYTLWHYDIEQDVRTQDSVGIVIGAEFTNGQAVFTCGVDESMLQIALPAARIDPQVSSPFETSASPGAPVPVVFGSSVPVQPPNIYVSQGGEGSLRVFDYALGYGNDLRLVDLFGDLDSTRTGLERYGTWVAAPGSPAYLATEGDPDVRATQFSVTGNQSVRFALGQPLRFKTTTSGSAYRYSAVAAYHVIDDADDQVEIYDALIDSGLNTVEAGGDYAIVRDVYTSVTDGLSPVPGSGVSLTAARLFGQEDSTILALVDNPSFPSGSGGTLPAAIIQAIITNAVWGCSARVQYVVDGTSFSSSSVVQSLAGLGGAIQGALGYDGKQVPAEQVLDWLCLIGRCRLGMDDRNRWTLTPDVETSSVATFHFGPGVEAGIRIKRVVSYGRVPLDRAVRNVVLHWMPLGRVRARVSQLTPQAYARYSTKAVSGVGQDRAFTNPFIRSEEAAERTLQYLAEMLAGADETLVFTAGPEARDRVAGEVITAISTVDGFSGDWKITEVNKSLTDVQLTCIRFNSDAYAEPSGIVHSAEPSDTPNTRTPPGPGPNLLPNPDLSPPLTPSTTYAGEMVPHGWEIGRPLFGAGTLAEFSLDESEAVRARTFGGHYIRMVWSTVRSGAPSSLGADGLVQIGTTAIKPGSDHFYSWYGDANEGWYVSVTEADGNNDLVSFGLVGPVIRDDTDTDSNGWERFYVRWRPMDATRRAAFSISVSQPGTYNIAALQLEPVTGSARRPSDWRRHTATPATLHRFETITLDGSDTYRASLIKAGDYVLGATLRVTDPIVFGTASHWSLGTDADLDAYARNITETFTATTSANFKAGSLAFFSAEDQDVVLSFYSAAGTPDTPGTATGGTVSIVLHYTRSAPTPGL